MVYVDGRYAGAIEPEDELRLDLALGRHDIEVETRKGRELIDRQVRVDRYEVAEIEVEGRHGHGHDAYSYHQRPDDDEDSDRYYYDQDRYVDISFRW